MPTDKTLAAKAAPTTLLKPVTVRHKHFGGMSATAFYELRRRDTTFPEAIAVGFGLPMFVESEILDWIDAQKKRRVGRTVPHPGATAMQAQRRAKAPA
jgi:predicted DNA-binding transcriptional regulator AlpA